MRRLPLLLALLALAACDAGGPRDALMDSRNPPGLAPRFLPPPGWAWGVVQPQGLPQVRYGVSAPVGRRALAQVVIVPSMATPAEVWFETARQLNSAGYAVWALERPGLGGSGRYVRPYDLVHSPGVATEAQVITSVLRAVVRPAGDGPIILLAAGDAAPAARLAAAAGAPVDALVLSAPVQPAARTPPIARWANRLGFGALPSSDWRPWSREDAGATGTDPWRSQTASAWMLANPDLRLSGASLGWRARHGSAHAMPPLPVLVLGEPAAICDQCTSLDLPGSSAEPQLDRDPIRNRWLAAVTDFLGEQVADPVDQRQPGAHAM